MPTNETPPLEGKVALLTGAVRRNGRAMAHVLARQGASVVINARASREEAEKVAAERMQRPFLDLSYEEWKRILSIVLDGAFLCSRARRFPTSSPPVAAPSSTSAARPATQGL